MPEFQMLARGRGLVEELLNLNGYTNLEALDISAGMLEKAREKNIYAQLYVATLGEPLRLPDNYFDAIISVGVFSPGQAPSRSLDELIRITKPDGHLIFTMRPDFLEESDFKEKLSRLEASGKWVLLKKSEPYQCMPKTEPEVIQNVFVYSIVS